MENRPQQTDDCLIERCPDDILLRVFELYISDSSQYHIDQKPRYLPETENSISSVPAISISHVSYRWRSLILSPFYTSLWSRIWTLSEKLFRVHLQRSGMALLDVYLSPSRIGHNVSEMVDLILPHIDRVAHIRVRDDRVNTISKLAVDAPRLESLSITFTSLSLTLPTLDLRSAPRMRELDLAGVKYPYQCTFTNLVFLRLDNVFDLPEVHKILRILKANPGLEELVLAHDYTVLAHEGPGPSNKITLPKLRKVAVGGYPALLEHIEIPPSAALRLIAPPTSWPTLGFAPTRLRIRGSARTLPPPTLTAVSDSPDRFVYYQALDNSTFNEALHYVFQSGLVLANVRELWMWECQIGIPKSKWVFLLGEMPALEELSVGPGLAGFILGALEAGEVPCPALHTLRLLRSSVKMEKERLIGVLKMRRERGCNLQTLEVYTAVGLEQETLDRLGKIVPNVRMFVQDNASLVPVMRVSDRLRSHPGDGWAEGSGVFAVDIV